MTSPSTPKPGAGPPAPAPQGVPPAPPQDQPVGAPDGQPIGLYGNAQEAVRSLYDGYSYWTGKLTEASFALSLAVIGANWAVFGSVDRIRGNLLTQFSIAAVILNLAISLIGSEILGELLRRRIDYAEEDHPRWQNEFDQNVGQATPWPFTRTLDIVGKFSRYAKVALPVIGGVLFGIALFSQPKAQPKKSESSRASLATPPVLSSAPEVTGQAPTPTSKTTPLSTPTPAPSPTPTSTPAPTATGFAEIVSDYFPRLHASSIVPLTLLEVRFSTIVKQFPGG